MAQACGENAGKILFRNQIVSSAPFTNKPYMCVHLRNRWAWQELSKVSAASLKKNIGKLKSGITEMMNNQQKTDKESNLEIKHNPIEDLNGTWIPTFVGEEIVYANKNNGDRWLYIVQNGEKKQWWMVKKCGFIKFLFRMETKLSRAT